jgi:chaperone required for assembly of F1-ATPase
VSRSNREQAGGTTHGQGQGQPLRFYQTVGIAAPAPIAAPGAGGRRAGHGDSEGYRLLLDGKPLRTPAKHEFAVPTRALAEAIAAEWQAQRHHIDPRSMPLTRLANSAIDGVAGRQAQVRAEIVKYLASDLVCYRAAAPSELVRRQAEAWDPILDWCEQALGVRLAVTQGVMPVAQPEDAGALLEAWLKARDTFALAALSVMTTLLGSAVLAVAQAQGRLDDAAAWRAAHIDEDFQAGKWGVDPLAKARRDQQWGQMQAASRLLRLLAQD